MLSARHPLLKRYGRWLWPLGLLASPSGLAYDVSWVSIDGGGTRAQGAMYELRGTVGQTDTAPRQQGNSFDLRAGFHREAPANPQSDSVFANSFE